MKKTKLSLNQLNVKSFATTANEAEAQKGGFLFSNDGTTCSIWCGTGPSCPECAYTVFETCNCTVPSNFPCP